MRDYASVEQLIILVNIESIEQIKGNLIDSQSDKNT